MRNIWNPYHHTKIPRSRYYNEDLHWDLGIPAVTEGNTRFSGNHAARLLVLSKMEALQLWILNQIRRLKMNSLIFDRIIQLDEIYIMSTLEFKCFIFFFLFKTCIKLKSFVFGIDHCFPRVHKPSLIVIYNFLVLECWFIGRLGMLMIGTFSV